MEQLEKARDGTDNLQVQKKTSIIHPYLVTRSCASLIS